MSTKAMICIRCTSALGTLDDALAVLGKLMILCEACTVSQPVFKQCFCKAFVNLLNCIFLYKD